MTGPKRTSISWKYFTDIGNYQAICKICNDIFSFKTSVSNLKKHVIRKHSSIYIATRNQAIIKKGGSNETNALIDHEYKAKEESDNSKDGSSVELQGSIDEYKSIEIQQDDDNETTDPMFVEFLEHTGSSPTHNTANSPSPSPPPSEIRRKRKRYSYSKVNVKEEPTVDPRHLLEIKRLELEMLREKNLYEKEKLRAQLDKDSLKVQERLVTFLEDIKPALIKFLEK